MGLLPLDLIKQQLLQRDPDAIVELLDISSEQLVDRFDDLIHEQRRKLESEFEILDSSTDDTELEEDEYEYAEDGDESDY